MTAPSMGDVLHEREAELAQLGRAVERALGGRGSVVLVEGSAGIGKSSLLNEACRMAEGRARVLRARGGEQERDIPLLVTRELFTPYVASAPAEELGRAFAGAAALAGPLLGRGVADAGTADAAFALVHGLYWLVANLTDDRPLVLVVDDVHWVDEATQRWLAYLLPRVDELPVALVLAVRPLELDPGSPLGVGLASARDVVAIRPGELTGPAASSLLRSLLPGAAQEFCVAAHRSSNGNPLLLRALAGAVQERGLEPTSDTARRLDEIGSVGLARILLPRLHALGDPTVRLARAVAVLGDGRSLVDAAEVAELDRETAAASYDALVAAEVLRRDGPAFTHPLARAVVTDDLPPGTMSRLHLRAARVLRAHGADAEAVARHLAATDPVREDWVVAVLRDAAALATSRGAPEAALRHLHALLREDLDRALRASVLLEAGWQAFRCGDPRGRAWLEEALATAADPETRVLAWLAVWNWRLILMDGHDPSTVTDGIPGDLEGDLALVVAGNALLDLGFSGAGLRSHPRLTSIAEPPAGETMFERMCLCGLAVDEMVAGGTAERAAHFADLGWGGGAALDEAGDFANPPWTIVVTGAVGRLRTATERAQQALAHATRRGSRAPAEWFVGAAGWTRLLAGDVVGAEAAMQPWLDQLELQVPVTLPTWVATVVDLQRQRDRPDAGEALLAQYGWLKGDPPANWHGAVLHDRRGALRLTAGRFAEALRDFERSGAVLESFEARRAVVPAWRLGAAVALAALGRNAEARALAEEQVADAQHWGAAPCLGASLRTLATVVGGQESVTLAGEAVAVLASSEAEGEHAEALLVLGRLLRIARDQTRARQVLDEALDIADRNGALLLVRLAEEELRVLGARPRRRATTGVRSLTPAELRVAQLAAEGLSNPEIAQSLFVTRKTVEKHLGSAFSKLHISSRDQLPVVLEMS